MIQFNLIQSNLTQSNLIQSNLIQSNLIQSNSIQSGQKGTLARGYKSRSDVNSLSGKKTLPKSSDIWIKVKTANKSNKSNNNSSMKKDVSMEQAVVDRNINVIEGQTVTSVSTILSNSSTRSAENNFSIG